MFKKNNPVSFRYNVTYQYRTNVTRRFRIFVSVRPSDSLTVVRSDPRVHCTFRPPVGCLIWLNSIALWRRKHSRRADAEPSKRHDLNGERNIISVGRGGAGPPPRRRVRGDWLTPIFAEHQLSTTGRREEEVSRVGIPRCGPLSVRSDVFYVVVGALCRLSSASDLHCSSAIEQLRGEIQRDPNIFPWTFPSDIPSRCTTYT